MLDVKQPRLWRPGLAQFFAHGANLLGQGGEVARGANDLLAHRLKARLKVGLADAKPRPGHGLVLPSPSGVAAALGLVVGKRLEVAHQQAGVAIGPQRGVDFVQIAFGGFDGQPVDDFAHVLGIDFAGLLVRVVVHKHNVQVAAIAQLFAAQLAVGQDGKSGRFAVALL